MPLNSPSFSVFLSCSLHPSFLSFPSVLTGCFVQSVFSPPVFPPLKPVWRRPEGRRWCETSWFKELFGYEAEERGEAYPPLETPEGKEVIVEFLEDHVRVVNTSYGQRAVINVKVGDENYSLWLSRIGLAREIALLEKKLGSLKGVKAKIINQGRRGKSYSYRVEQVEG